MKALFTLSLVATVACLGATPEIDSATIDYATNAITVAGHHLSPGGSTPTVTFGGATSMTCGVTFSPSDFGSLICTDNADTVPVAAGDEVVVVLSSPTLLLCAPSGSCQIAANVAIEKQ